MAFEQLPMGVGRGYYSYSDGPRQFGTKETIKALQEIARSFQICVSDREIGIGDISFANGRHMPPHQTHRKGTNIDIRPFRLDNEHKPVTYQDRQYDRRMTEILVEILLAHSNVKGVLFNDTNIRRVKTAPGHNNHLHVKMKK